MREHAGRRHRKRAPVHGLVQSDVLHHGDRLAADHRARRVEALRDEHPLLHPQQRGGRRIHGYRSVLRVRVSTRHRRAYPTYMSCSSPLPVPPKKRKWRPSGRNCGKRWLPPPDGSCVTGTGVPPVAITRIRTPEPAGANTMTPSWFHVPPRPVGASASYVRVVASQIDPSSACRRQKTQSRGHPASRTDSGLPRCPRAAAPSPGRAAAPRAAARPRPSRRTPAAGRRPTARTIPDRSSAAWGSQSASEAAQVPRDGGTA